MIASLWCRTPRSSRAATVANRDGIWMRRSDEPVELDRVHASPCDRLGWVVVVVERVNILNCRCDALRRWCGRDSWQRPALAPDGHRNVTSPVVGSTVAESSEAPEMASAMAWTPPWLGTVTPVCPRALRPRSDHIDP
jgi:hypothetical protein